MSYILQDLAYGIGGSSGSPVGGVWDKLNQRSDINSRVYGWLRDAILELSRTYRFGDLERTGPQYTLIAGVSSYANDLLIQGSDAGRVTNLIPNIYRYFNYPIGSGSSGASGSNLVWKTVDAIEAMLNQPGIPAYFTRYQNKFLFAPVQQSPLVVYMRYQIEHPFSTIPVGTDAFLMPNEWMEIAEYAAAYRGAINLRMLDYASQYHTMLFGDPEFQRSSGGTGMPGLIFRRITQMEGDSISMMRQIRVNVSR